MSVSENASETSAEVLETFGDIAGGKICKYGKIALSEYRKYRDATNLLRVVRETLETNGTEAARETFLALLRETISYGDFASENPEIFVVATTMNRFLDPATKLLDDAGAEVNRQEFIAVKKFFHTYFFGIRCIWYTYQQPANKRWLYSRGKPKFQEFQQQLRAYANSLNNS